MKNDTALTSGRYDPLTPGHICSILRIAKRHKKIVVVVLDYPERRFPVDYTMTVLHELFERAVAFKLEFVVNDVHFGKISKDELLSYGADVYYGGNHRVLRHIEQLGFPVHYMERAYDYSARDIPLPG